jgi:peptidoglycan/LPS O-acetylase OafA/YrhL
VDSLLLGSLAAMDASSDTRSSARWFWLMGIGGAASALHLFTGIGYRIVDRFSFGLLFSSLCFVVFSNSGSSAIKFLRFKPLTALGKISYGLYVWHLPVMLYVPHFARRWFRQMGNAPFSHFAIFFCVTVLVSICSWFLLERPMLKLKRFFALPEPDVESEARQ